MPSEIPQQMKALVIEDKGKAAVKNVPVPQVADDEILVKVSHVSLNPTDWKHLDLVGNPSSILGCDYYGRVVRVGKSVSASEVSEGSEGSGWKEGDRASGFVHGGKFPDKGAFAEYAVVKAKLAYKVPEGVPDEAAPTYGVGFTTAAMVLYHEQKVPYPPAKVEGEQYYLVSGGSTSVGLSLIPLLVHAGYRIIATASPHSVSLVKSYGAHHVVDYHDVPAALASIRDITGGAGVHAALECVGGEDNFKLSIGAIRKEGGKVTTLTLIPEGAEGWREEVDVGRVLLYTVGGYSFEFIPGRPPLPAIAADNAWMASFAPRASAEIIGAGAKYPAQPNPLDVRKEGLDKIVEGLDELRQNKVSGRKIVYQIA